MILKNNNSFDCYIIVYDYSRGYTRFMGYALGDNTAKEEGG